MNQTARRGPIARFFIGLWDAMNFTRRLIFNLVFFVLLIMLLAVIGNGDRVEPLLDDTALVIAPEGALVEQYSIDPTTASRGWCCSSTSWAAAAWPAVARSPPRWRACAKVASRWSRSPK